LFRERYRLDRASAVIRQLVVALGDLDDCDEDALPMCKQELAAWWRHRQARLIRNLGW
jgi:hypothetical protein